MDLSRWSLERLSRFADRYRELKIFLADVLDGERVLSENPEEEASRAHFEVCSDFSVLRKLEARRAQNEAERAGIVFGELASFFEAGFFLRSSVKTGKAKASYVELESMFVFGRVFSPDRKERPRFEMKLPSGEPFRVFKGYTAAVLKPFRLDSSKRLRDASAFTFSPYPDLHFILICSRPQLWQVSAIEEACLGSCEFIYGKDKF